MESIRGPSGPRTVQVNGRYLAAALPIAIVGGALGGDCAPLDANYRCGAVFAEVILKVHLK